MRNPDSRGLLLTLLLLLAVGASGCSSHINYRLAESAVQRQEWDDAVVYYLKALEDDPGNVRTQTALLRAKIKASQAHFKKGQDFAKAGVLERALVEYQQAVQLDPTNQYAMVQLESVNHRIQTKGRESNIDEMKAKNSGSRPQPPRLNPRSDTPISLEIPEPRSIFAIYQALGNAFGINILFDPQLRDAEIQVPLRDVRAQDALEILMRAAGHFYKVLDEHTILIAADTPQNRRMYEDQVIQTFFLSNADVKDMLGIVRGVVQIKSVTPNEQLNAIIMRDSADKVKVAEKIIETNDKSRAEVVVDVELLQINSSRLRQLGMELSEYSIGQKLDLGGEDTPIRVSDLSGINQSNWILTLPTFLYNFVKTSGDAQLLAKPQLRITDGEKANLVIGDRVPIPLTTFNTQNVGGAGGIVPITSFQYQDVGIRIDIEPRVHHNQEVTLKLKVEVSNVGEFVEGSGGQKQPIIGTRTIESTIRLKDGETNFLAGLIRSDETSSERGIPGLSDIPVLGRIFSSKTNNNSRTDVILTLTPHIIRGPQITEEDLLPIWVGTEANMTFRGGSPRVESEVDGPFDGNEGTPEEIQEAIRRRIQRLPRGLRPGETGDEIQDPQATPQPTTVPGVNLVPVAPPQDIFRPAQPSDVPQNQPDVIEPEPEEIPPPPAVSDSFRGQDASSAASIWKLDLGLGDFRLASFTGRSAPAFVRAAARPSAVRIWMEPAAATVARGKTLVVDVLAEAGRPVSHLPLALRYDPLALEVVRVDAGDLLGPTGEAQLLSDWSHPGELLLGASRLGDRPGVQGTGKVARVTFRALATGRTPLTWSGNKALDRALRPLLPLAAEPLEIEIAAPGPPRHPPVISHPVDRREA
jgi:general secretion pathway protein D